MAKFENIEVFTPPGLGPVQGLYSQCTRVKAGTDTFHIAGQLAVGMDGSIVGRHDFAAQFHQVFDNMGAVLAALGESFDSVIVFRTYLTHSQDIELFMGLRAALFPKIFSTSDYPPNTLLVIDRLVKEDFLIEIEAVAAANG